MDRRRLMMASGDRWVEGSSIEAIDYQYTEISPFRPTLGYALDVWCSFSEISTENFAACGVRLRPSGRYHSFGLYGVKNSYIILDYIDDDNLSNRIRIDGSTDGIWHAHFENGNTYLEHDGVVVGRITNSISDFTRNTPLFALHWDGTYQTQRSAVIYRVILRAEEGRISHDLVPSKREGVSLRNMMNNKYYTNLGTGSFIYHDPQH